MSRRSQDVSPPAGPSPTWAEPEPSTSSVAAENLSVLIPFSWSRSWINRTLIRLGFPSDWFLVPLAALIGTLAGLAAQGYGRLVRLSERFFSGILEQGQNQGQYWLLMMILLLPAIGGLMVGLIKRFFDLPRISHGIPEVVHAVARRQGRLRLRTGIFTAVNSALTLGSGGSVGQEGPIVQIGAVVASVASQALKVGREHIGTLVGCGSAAGLAAIFNAPIAGVIFVLEVILRDYSIRTFTPIVIASVFGVTINQAIEHHAGALLTIAHPSSPMTLRQTMAYLLLGVICGLLAGLYQKIIASMEHSSGRLKHIPVWIQPALGGLFLGCMGAALWLAYPHAISAYRLPAFFGNGYPVIEALMDPASYNGTSATATLTLGFVLLALAGKLLGTGLSLGSGGVGGLFAPALFIGSASGGLLGILLRQTGLFPHLTPASFALAGMAGVLSGSMRCPLTAFILTFELTRDYNVILPVMLVSMLSTLTAQLITPHSIYTQTLREMGLPQGKTADWTLLRRLNLSELSPRAAVTIHLDEPAKRLLDLLQTPTADGSPVSHLVVVDRQSPAKYLGMILSSDLQWLILNRDAGQVMIAAEMMRSDLPTLSVQATFEQAMNQFARHRVEHLALLSGDGRVVGTISRSDLMTHYQQALDRDET